MPKPGRWRCLPNQTVKAQNVEVVSRWKWQEMYHRYISHLREDRDRNGAEPNQPSTAKLSQLMVLWVGASMVLRGELTLGQLIAFRIISGRHPTLLRLSTLASIQELKVSFERLAGGGHQDERRPEQDPLPCARLRSV